MSKPAVELTESEWSIIKAVWETEPCTAPAIQERLAATTGWTYSTVTRAQAQSGELFYALKHAFNGALTPMVQCLLESKDLKAEELAELEALIKAKKKSAKK